MGPARAGETYSPDAHSFDVLQGGVDMSFITNTHTNKYIHTYTQWFQQGAGETYSI